MAASALQDLDLTRLEHPALPADMIHRIQLWMGDFNLTLYSCIFPWPLHWLWATLIKLDWGKQ